MFRLIFEQVECTTVEKAEWKIVQLYTPPLQRSAWRWSYNWVETCRWNYNPIYSNKIQSCVCIIYNSYYIL